MGHPPSTMLHLSAEIFRRDRSTTFKTARSHSHGDFAARFLTEGYHAERKLRYRSVTRAVFEARVAVLEWGTNEDFLAWLQTVPRSNRYSGTRIAYWKHRVGGEWVFAFAFVEEQ